MTSTAPTAPVCAQLDALGAGTAEADLTHTAGAATAVAASTAIHRRSVTETLELSVGGGALGGVVLVLIAHALSPGFMFVRLLPWRFPALLIVSGVIGASVVFGMRIAQQAVEYCQRRFGTGVAIAVLLAAGVGLTGTVPSHHSFRGPQSLVSLVPLALAPGLLGIALLAVIGAIAIVPKPYRAPRSPIVVLSIPYAIACVALAGAVSWLLRGRNLEWGFLLSAACAGGTFTSWLASAHRSWVKRVAVAGLFGLGILLGVLNAWADRHLLLHLHVAACLATLYSFARALPFATPQRLRVPRRFRPVFAAVGALAVLLAAVDPLMRLEVLGTQTAPLLGQSVHVFGLQPGTTFLPDAPVATGVAAAKPVPGKGAVNAGTELPHIVLICVDTLRADRLNPELMPYTAAHAARGTNFVKARTPRPKTRGAIGSTVLGHVTRPGELFSPNNLFSRLRKLGYTTGYVGIADPNKLWNLGVERVVLHPLEPKWDQALSRRLIADFGRTLDEARHPQLSLIHLPHPHAPYTSWSKPSSRKPEAVYDASVRDVDSILGELFQILDRIENRPVLTVLFADHGEEFHEHGGAYHSKTLYEEQLRIPLVFVGPGIERQRVTTDVSLIDIAPTLFDLLGTLGSERMEGRSLHAVLHERKKLDPRPVVFQTGVGDYVDLRGAALGPWKLVENRVSGTLELYHLDEDPREQRILFDRLGDAPPVLFHALGLKAPKE